MFLCAFGRLAVSAGQAHESLAFVHRLRGLSWGSFCFMVDLSVLVPTSCCTEAICPVEACPSNSTHLSAQLLVPDAARVANPGPMTIWASGLACRGRVPGMAVSAGDRKGACSTTYTHSSH